MSPRAAGALLVALLAASGVPPAAGGPIRITCQDGGSVGVLQAFGRRLRVGWCDLDRSCDGNCTVVVPSPHDVRCYVLFGGSCGGGGGPEVGSPVVPVCNASVAIPLTDVRPRRTLFAG